METVGLQSILLLFHFAQILHCWTPYENCPDGYMQRLNGNCYAFKGGKSRGGDYRMDYLAASNDCRKDGGYLASITSAEEQQFIENWTGFHAVLVKNGIWIGLMRRRPGSNEDPQFTWASFDTFDYQNWAANNPDMNPNAVACVEMARYGYKWNDISCSEKRHYICEIAVDMIGKVQACGMQQVPCDGNKHTTRYLYSHDNMPEKDDEPKHRQAQLLMYLYFNLTGHAVVTACSNKTEEDYLAKIQIFNSMDTSYYANSSKPDVILCGAPVKYDTETSYDPICPYSNSSATATLLPCIAKEGYYAIGIYGKFLGSVELSVTCRTEY